MFQYLTTKSATIGELIMAVNAQVKGAKDRNGAPLRLVQIIQDPDGQFVGIIEQTIK